MKSPMGATDAACQLSTGEWTRRVRSVRGKGHGVSVWYGGSLTERQRDEHRVEVLVVERREVLGRPDLDETEGLRVRVEGRGVSGWYGERDAACPISTG